MRVRRLNESYRGHELGYVETINGIRAAFRSSMDVKWRLTNVFAASAGEAPNLARACIDWQYRIDAAEVEAGRELTHAEMVEVMKGAPE